MSAQGITNFHNTRFYADNYIFKSNIGTNGIENPGMYLSNVISINQEGVSGSKIVSVSLHYQRSPRYPKILQDVKIGPGCI